MLGNVVPEHVFALLPAVLNEHYRFPLQQDSESPPSQRRRFRVRAAFLAAAERDRAERCLASRFACLDNVRFDADRRLSRLSARLVARERVGGGFLLRPARTLARCRLAGRCVRALPPLW